MTRRKDGIWQEILIVNGKRKYFYGKTKAETLRKLMDFKEKESKGVSFKVVADCWWGEHCEKISYNTQRGYKAAYERLVEQFGDISVKDISAKEIDSWLKRLASKGYSQKTLSAHRLVANLVFSYAVVEGYAENNPCTYISLPKGKPKQQRELPSDADIDRIKKSTDLPLGLLHYFVLYTGCRRGEAMGVKFSDIDYENGVIRISRSVYYDGATPVTKSPKTSAGYRDIILLEVLKDKLPKGRGDSYIFFPKGLPYKTTFERGLRKYRELAGISCTLHQIRHAYATILYEAGVDEKSAQQLMGHSSIQMTKDIYTHIRQAKNKATAQLLNEYVKNM